MDVLGPILCELGALARNPLQAVQVAARVPGSHRKGAKDAKGDSQASNSNLDNLGLSPRFFEGWIDDCRVMIVDF